MSSVSLRTDPLLNLRAAAAKDPKLAVKEAAKQFESLFMQELLKSMRSATLASGMMENSGTQMGTELVDVLMVMVGWGDKWLAGKAGPPVLYRHHACGEVSRVDLRCAGCGEPMHADDVDVLPGPGAAA